MSLKARFEKVLDGLSPLQSSHFFPNSRTPIPYSHIVLYHSHIVLYLNELLCLLVGPANLIVAMLHTDA